MTPSSKIARVPPLDDPPVSVAFIEERCRTLVAECTETSDVHVDGLSRLSRLRIFAAVSAKPVACRKLFAPGG